MKRLLYLLYYLKQLDREKFKLFSDYVLNRSHLNRFDLYVDIIRSVFRYNVSILDYFYFRFFEKNQTGRNSFAGTGFMYEYQLKMNPKESRDVLEDKLKFLDHYKKFIGHKHLEISCLGFDKIINMAKEHKIDKFVLKGSLGQCGEGVWVIDLSKNLDPISEVSEFSQYDLMEEYIVQHSELMRLSPSGLNTIRIFTQIDNKGNVDLLGCRLRISVDSQVDNLAAGNMAAPVDDKSGIVIGPGVYSDITKTSESVHPITKATIEGFQVPYWTQTVEMVKLAALFDTRNKSIGWDIAITEKGPFLLEGNHNWCKLLWQLPVNKGLKNKLEAYLV